MKVAVLMNFIPPYHVLLLSLLSTRVNELRILVSTVMEANREWKPEWGGLRVILQRTLTIPSKWKHPAGFVDAQYIHIPLDTIPLLTRCRPDVIISMEMGMRSIGAILYGRTHPATRVFLWLNLSERTERGRGVVRLVLRRLLLLNVDGVFVNGQSGVGYLRRLGVPAVAIHLLPYSTDPLFAETPVVRAEPTAKRLLFVGQLVPRKGIEPFLRSLCRWATDHRAQRIEMTIIGEGHMRRAIERLLAPPNLTLILLGSVPYNQLPARYASCGILVFPTLADEWGIVVNEAMASGLPVLGSIHSQAVRELVDDGTTGWIFDPESPESTNTGLDRALLMPADDLASMRARCRERALRYTPEKLIGGILEAISGPGGDNPGGPHDQRG